ncbi:hypothetical protein [Frigoriglobus tundricola]|uniref:Uncharacterized protein n=1 Tax=Frigoriglobus tundricola TaxID=2774151 RepID=A0A6M5Z139_9BACT|nr:hypothetical protein [Frigoriglobus tundricola]QJW99466.1 hypothetical protein FTUN_7078 [Frigoriglobus tundricola]
MAQQMITLEEAAEKLGISPEEMKKRLKTDPDFRRLSQIRDGSNVRFKLSAIEELARQLGMASDQGLSLAAIPEETPGSDDFKVPGIEEKKKPKKVEDEPLDFGTSDDDVFSLSEEPKQTGPKSGGKLTPPKSATKGLSDSSAGKPDSDVRLAGGKAKKSKESDESAVPTEEISLDFSGPGSAVIKGGSSAKLSAPKAGGASGKLVPPGKGDKIEKPPADSSEFELSLDADSDDFELQMNSDADEVDLGTMPKDKAAGPSSKHSGKSGINLRDPADSGISLEKGKDKKGGAKKPDDSEADSDVDFELSLDSSAAVSSSKLGAPKSGKLVLDSDSDSEFELTLDDSGASSLEQAALDSNALDEAADKGDIFETDFEIPPMPDESASEAVPLESDTDLEKSDFELAADDSDVVAEEPSQSEVVLLEDEDETNAAKSIKKVRTRTKPSDADVDLDGADVEADEGSLSRALKTAEEPEPVEVFVERPTKPWGIVPVLFLAPSLLVVLLGTIIGFEMLQTMWGYQQPRKPAAPLIRALASNLDMELRDQ